MDNELEIIRGYVLNAVANDYENLDLIAKEAAQWALEEKSSFSRELLTRALSTLIHDGLVDCYRFSQFQSNYERCEFEIGKLNDLWFYISKKGKGHPAVT
jgi:hypothetical protein